MDSESSGLTATKRSVDEFHVVDAKTASWVARKINEARGHQRRVKAWAERELKRAKRREQFFLGRFGAELEAWMRGELARSRRKTKSIDLPGGKLCLRTQRLTLAITDERRLIAWARQHLPSAVKTVESIAKTELNRHLADTGEVADGTELSGGGERLIIGDPKK